MHPPAQPRRRPRVSTGHEIPDTLAFAITADNLADFENEIMGALDDGWETRPEFPWRVTTIPKELAKGTARTTHFYHILLFKITDWSTRKARERTEAPTDSNDIVRQMQQLTESTPERPTAGISAEQPVTVVARETYVTTIPAGEILSPEARQRLQRANEDKKPK